MLLALNYAFQAWKRITLLQQIDKITNGVDEQITWNSLWSDYVQYSLEHFVAMRFEFHVVFNRFNPIYTFWNTKRRETWKQRI